MDPSGIRLTACMMVKNEEEMLPRCLESIRGRVDEIVVVDTGSTDRTVEIALSFGARVHHHPWRNDFSLHRNQSISYASGKWVFIIDADEEYRPSPRASLREETALAEEKGFDTLVMRVENLHREGTETVCSDSLRVFRRNGRIRYEGIVHNELTGWGNPGSSTGRIVHYGYDRGAASARRKFERTATLLRKQIAENPENAGAHMYLSCSHASLGQNEEALREALAAVDLVEAQGITNVHFTRAYYGAVRCLILEKRYGEAEALCERARARFGDQIDLYAALTMIRFETGDWEGVVASGTRYRELLEAHRNFRGPSVMTHVSSYGDEWKV
ncbi:MAG TPA: glycosyltransferase, partial [Syntrophales bacterium]|nr:glycosyltransferase [Syntrophales bacterium]